MTPISRTHRATRLTTLLLSLALACGQATRDPDARTGPTDGGAGGSAAGGAGQCQQLDALEVGPFAEEDVAFGPVHTRLLRTPEEEVTLVFVNVDFEPEVGQLTFDAFGQWPSVLPVPTRVTLPVTGFFWGAGVAPGGGATLLFSDYVAPVSHILWVPRLSPGQTESESEVVAFDAGFPCLALGSGEKYLLGFWNDSGHRLIRIGKERITHDVGCLRVASACARALATDAGFLIAVPAAEPFGNCSPDPNLPRQVQVYVWGDTDAPTLAGEWATDGWFPQLEMAARSDGAWVVWRETPNDGAIKAQRVSQLGRAVGEPLIVLHEAATFGLTATSLGDDLVVAVRSSQDHFIVRRISTQGDLVWEWRYGPPTNQIGFPADLLGSPDGRSLLLATARDTSYSSVDVGHVIRWDCTPNR